MRTIETPEEMAALMRECIALTYEWIERVNQKYGILIPKVKVVFSIKSTTAGRAYLGKNVIAYNPTLLRENTDNFLNRTVGHEVMHFAAYLKFGDAAHGPDWHRMMRECGLNDKRCHSYDTRHVPSRVGKSANPRPHSVIRTNTGVIKTIGIGRVTEFD